MNASTFLQLVVNGLSMGAIYILLVFGLQVIIRTTGIVNFAHGEYYAIAAYAFWFTYQVLKINVGPSILLALLAIMILGAITYRLIFHYVQRRFRPDTALSNKLLLSAIASVGLMMVLARVIVLYFGTDTKGVPSFFPQILQFGSIRLPAERLAILAVSILIAGLLYLLFFRTKLGKSMRAVSSDALASSLMGIDSSRIFLISFVLGCTLAAIAGIMLAPILTISADMGSAIIFMAMLVMVLGGIYSFKGAVISGVVVGLFLSFGYQFWGNIANYLIFVVVIVFLLFRPGGFFGQTAE